MNEQQANTPTPALEGQITVASFAGAAASGAIVIASITGAQYVKICLDKGDAVPLATYMTTKRGGAPTTPDPTATSGGGQTQLYTAAELADKVFTPGDQVRFYQPTSGTIYVRQSPA